MLGMVYLLAIFKFNILMLLGDCCFSFYLLQGQRARMTQEREIFGRNFDKNMLD